MKRSNTAGASYDLYSFHIGRYWVRGDFVVELIRQDHNVLEIR